MMDKNIFAGKEVRILDNAFEGSDDPEDFKLRGKVGEVAEIWPDGEVLVIVGGIMAYLTIDEIGEIEASSAKES